MRRECSEITTACDDGDDPDPTRPAHQRRQTPVEAVHFISSIIRYIDNIDDPVACHKLLESFSCQICSELSKGKE
jgi:hypothetical protein